MEKAIRGFVAFVQSYMKHECGLIFCFKGVFYGEAKSPKYLSILSSTFLSGGGGGGGQGDW